MALSRLSFLLCGSCFLYRFCFIFPALFAVFLWVVSRWCKGIEWIFRLMMSNRFFSLVGRLAELTRRVPRDSSYLSSVLDNKRQHYCLVTISSLCCSLHHKRQRGASFRYKRYCSTLSSNNKLLLMSRFPGILFISLSSILPATQRHSISSILHILSQLLIPSVFSCSRLRTRALSHIHWADRSEVYFIAWIML